MSVNTLHPAPLEALQQIGIETKGNVHYQQTPTALVEQTLQRNEGVLNDTGALIIKTGEFTGRSPKDKFIVKDSITTDTVHWNDFNIPIEEKYFDSMYQKLTKYLADKEIWVRDSYACADSNYRLNIRVINENPWSNLFAYNMFLRPTESELEHFKADWHIIQAPNFKADAAVDGTRQHNFAMVSFSKKTILIGGSGYTGEMKKEFSPFSTTFYPKKKMY